MNPARWLKLHTSMRGRLSLMLMLCLVLPLALTVLLNVHRIGDEEQSRREVHATNIENNLLWRLEEAVFGFQRCLEDSLDVLALYASRLPANDPSAWPAGFDDLEPNARPTAIVDWTRGRSAWPESLTEPLRELVEAGEPVRGFAILPRAGAEATGNSLYQVVVEPLDGDSPVVALRDLSASPGVLGSLPFSHTFDRMVTIGTDTVARYQGLSVDGSTATAAAAPEIGWDVWRDARLEEGVQRFKMGDGIHGALPIRDVFGDVVGLAVVGSPRGGLASWPVDAHDAEPSSPLFAQMRTMVGWIAIVGVLLALGMGFIAPNLIWSDIRESTSRIFGSVERLRELVGRNGRALNEQMTAIGSLTTSVSDLETASRSIHETTQQLAKSAEQSAHVSQSGNHRAEMAQQTVLDVRNQVADISQLMDQLGSRSREIGEILEYLDALNNGTRKLSVNATIRAEDTGSATRQLNYVAGEIRDLAIQAVDYTQDIERRVKEIQKSSESTLTATKKGREEVERCLESFKELEVAFGRILHWVDETTQFSHAIEASTSTQARSLDVVTNSVSALKRRSRETEANFRDIEDAIDELAALGEEMMVHWKVG